MFLAIKTENETRKLNQKLQDLFPSWSVRHWREVDGNAAAEKHRKHGSGSMYQRDKNLRCDTEGTRLASASAQFTDTSKYELLK